MTDMGNLGVRVIVGQLCGNEDTRITHKAAMGKTIKELFVDNDKYRDGALIMKFTDNTGIVVRDDGRSCCEERYIHTDDDLQYYVGSVFNKAELREAPNQISEDDDDYGGEHEVRFLIINTDKGSFTLETHNIHNGYYGGFWIVIEPI